MNRYHSLSGKARRNHIMSRASRIHAQQLIEDFLDSADERARERDIPIRSRAEFFPTASQYEVDSSTKQPGDRSFDDRGSARGNSPVATTATAAASRSPAEGVICIPSRRAAPVDESLQAPTKMAAGQLVSAALAPNVAKAVRPRAFDPKRFFFGCAIGSAAAAMLLLFVQVFFL